MGSFIVTAIQNLSVLFIIDSYFAARHAAKLSVLILTCEEYTLSYPNLIASNLYLS